MEKLKSQLLETRFICEIVWWFSVCVVGLLIRIKEDIKINNVN